MCYAGLALVKLVKRKVMFGKPVAYAKLKLAYKLGNVC